MLARGLAGGLAVLVVLALTAARDERALDALASRNQSQVGVTAGQLKDQARSLTSGQRALARVRAGTFRCQDALGVARAPVQYRRPRGGMLGFAYWRWYGLRRDVCGELARLRSDPVRAIRAVFGEYGSQAVAVARCETGGTFSVYASNGQYLGLFQMGSYARSAYGHSYTALEQARAAYRYFVASGRDWSPWECKPWGVG